MSARGVSAAPPAAAPPAWFTTALAAEPEEGSVAVAGAEIAWLAWGDRSAPTLVLVHGGAAHARWWRAHGPLLATHHRVVALDLSGHGASDRRSEYRAETWAQEVLAAAAAGGGAGRPVVVGHSMGGFVTVVAAACHGADLEGAVVLDAPIRRPDPESEEGRGGRMFRSPKVYPDLATAVEHFHLVPPQPSEHTWLLDQVARDSLHQVAGGWTWRFDPGVFTARLGPSRPSEVARELLAQVACRVAIVTGAESSIVDAEVRAYMAELLEGSPAAAAGIPFVEVPAAHHHLLLDQPIATVTAIRAVLATWRPVGAAPAQIAPR
jgi:pimeloyl-ACP methyl ester carboxylesterase